MTLSVNIAHHFDGFELSADFEAGSGITALFGRSGAGKSTVINAVAGLLHPVQGRITLEGETLFDSSRNHFTKPAARRLGCVFQDARLFPHLTVSQNLLFGRRYAPTTSVGPEMEDVVRLLGLDALLQRQPSGLSGGEKQRVALGRALLSNPRMLLMDEPLASLDGPRKQEILPYLERLRDGPLQMPILYVSHAVDEVARLADTLVLLRGGKVALQGPIFDVMSDPTAVPLLGVRDAGAVVEAIVEAQEDDGLARLRLSGGTLLLPGVIAEVGSRLRLRILAQDVMLAKEAPRGLSALNVLPVTIEKIFEGDGPGAAVALRAGQDRLLARVTRRAVAELGLAEAQDCFAVIKATSVAPGSIGR